MIVYTTAKNDSDLTQILDLQRSNLRHTVAEDSVAKEGFVTVEHDLDLLRKMNNPYPHIVAKSDEKVVGYALVMLKQLSQAIPILIPMFDMINRCMVEGKKLSEHRYFVMGQVCVARTHRGKGIFRGLYNKMAEEMKNDFDYILTEINVENERSVQAHSAVGFQQIKIHQTEDGRTWSIVLLPI